MKTFALTFASCLLIVACGDSNNNNLASDNAALKRQVDSLTLLLNPVQERAMTRMALEATAQITSPINCRRLASLDEGIEYARNFHGMPSKESIDVPAAWLFDAYVFDSLLAVDGARFVRLYPAVVKGDKHLTMIAVPADEAGNDILGEDSYKPHIFDFTTICPQECGVNNQLNPNPKMCSFTKD
jgi:hypothetical protein